MVNYIIALVVFAAALCAATFYAIRMRVKDFCKYKGMDFQRYWHDLLRGKVRVKDSNNPYVVQRYRKEKEDGKGN